MTVVITNYGHKRVLKDTCSPGNLGPGVEKSIFCSINAVEKDLDYKTQDNLNRNNENAA